jgi:hypothetical protein
MKEKTNSFINTTQYFFNQGNLSSNDLEPPPDLKPQQPLDHILRFLDLGKSDFDTLNHHHHPKLASIIDINKSTDIPLNLEKKKNKNDFYRFLLT